MGTWPGFVNWTLPTTTIVAFRPITWTTAIDATA